MTPKDIRRQEKLEVLQEQHGRLTAHKKGLRKQVTKLTDEIGVTNKELERLGGQIFDLKNEDGDTPHITDHAIVRYLERVKGMNIWEIKAEIVNNIDAVRINNTIVTVNGNEDEDQDVVL